jgi:hypothetical protein
LKAHENLDRKEQLYPLKFMTKKTAKYLLMTVTRLYSVVLWTVFILVVTLYLGKWNIVSPVYAQPIDPGLIIAHVDNQSNREIVEAQQAALAKAEEVANARLDAWISERMAYVDPLFLDWYFGYWTKEKREILKNIYDVLNRFDHSSFSPGSKKIVDDVHDKFEQLVLPPNHLQIELNSIAREVARSYEQDLQGNLLFLRNKYLVSNQKKPNIKPQIDKILDETLSRLNGRAIDNRVNELARFTKAFGIGGTTVGGDRGLISEYNLKFIKRIDSTVVDSEAKKFLSSIISKIEANPQIIIAVGIITIAHIK